MEGNVVQLRSIGHISGVPMERNVVLVQWILTFFILFAL